ncbi:MAG: HEAT repeat domain-containing protein [Candidatus Firestonebacteria bacterium]
MFKTLITFFTFLTLFISFTVSCSADERAQNYFTDGVQKYIKGDVDRAIFDIENSLKLDKENKKYISFLVKMLVEKGSEYYLQRKLNEAFPYFEKASKLSPEDKKVKEMHNIIYKELFPTAEIQPIQKTEPSYEEMAKLFAEFQKQQQKLISTVLGPTEKTLESIISKVGDERREFLKAIVKRDEDIKQAFKENQKIISKNFSITILIFIIGIIFVVIVFSYVSARLSARREGILLQHQERIISNLLQQNVGSTQLIGESSSPLELMEGSHPKDRVKGVEIIEAELVEETDADIAQKLLVPFLEDNDDKVKATASKALYKYNPNKALQILKEMSKNKNRVVRLNAAWGLGEIGSDLSAEILLNLINDVDYHVKRVVLKFLQKILKTNKDNLPVSLSARISKELTDVKIKEGWVM